MKRKEVERYWACSRKRRFDRPGQAASAAKRKGLKFYDCKHCGGLHLTSKPVKTRRGVEAPAPKEK